MNNLPATISSLNRQIFELTEKLSPATEDQVSRGVRSLLAAGLALPSGMQADKAPEIYAFALSGVPGIGVQKAIAKIIRGEYEINRAFVPSPPELAAMARAESRTIREDKTRLMEKMRAMEREKPPPVSEEGKQRIKAMLHDFRQNHSASKALNSTPEVPMDEERAAYYEKIMALSDAKTVEVSHSAFRTAISRKIDSARQE